MSAFAGFVAIDAGAPDQQTEEILRRSIGALRPGNVSTRRLAGAVFAQRTAASSTGSRDGRLSLIARDGWTLYAAAARLDNREELGAALALAPSDLAQLTDSHLLLRVLEHQGENGLARCLGAFAFALWDSESQVLTLGRDCLGNKLLFYHCGRGFVAFATTLGALLALPNVPREIDDVALAHFIALNTAEGSRTLYRGIERVPSRSLVTIDRNGARCRHYWVPKLDAPPPYRREEDYVARARELFDQAVAAAVRDTPDVAISTSGGLDSSAIAATVARLGTARSVTCFTLLPPTGTQIDVGPYRYLDERDKVTALARMHPQLAVRWIVPDRSHPLDDDYGRYFARANVPVLGPSVYATYLHLVDAVAAADYPVLLFGSCGDFGLTWFGRFSLVALLRAGAWREFVHELRMTARQSGRSLAQTFAGDVIVQGAPPALRRAIHRMRGRNPDSVARYSALNPGFIVEHGLARQWRAQGFDPWFGGDGWHPARHRAARMFDRDQAWRDMAAMRAEIGGVEFRDPHADRRLLEFMLSVPEPLFRRNGVPRAFARKVLADRLPPEILNERRRGASLPHWFRLLQARKKDIAAEIDRIEASALARRLIDVPRLKKLMEEWPNDDNAAQKRFSEYHLALTRAVHVGQFIRWVEGGNA